MEEAYKNRRTTSCHTPRVSELCDVPSGKSFSALELDLSVDAAASAMHGEMRAKCKADKISSHSFGLVKTLANAWTVGGDSKSALAPKSSRLNRSRNIQISIRSAVSECSVNSGSILRFGVMTGGE